MKDPTIRRGPLADHVWAAKKAGRHYNEIAEETGLDRTFVSQLGHEGSKRAWTMRYRASMANGPERFHWYERFGDDQDFPASDVVIAGAFYSHTAVSEFARLDPTDTDFPRVVDVLVSA